MIIAAVLHKEFSSLRPLPFTLSDALLVLFLHDLEKPWAYTPGKAGIRGRGQVGVAMRFHQNRPKALAERRRLDSGR